MKKEVRTTTVEYNVYIAKDGKEFNSPEECEHYEMILDGTRIVCPECNGKGKIATKEKYDNYIITQVLRKYIQFIQYAKNVMVKDI